MMTREASFDFTSVSSSVTNSFPAPYEETIFEKKFLGEWNIICKCDCYSPEKMPKNIRPFSFPRLCYLELTYNCNNSCSGCQSRLTNSKSKTLGCEQWKIIFNKLKPYVHRLHLTGGEATKHPEFKSIVKCLQELDIPFTLFTNARWQFPQSLLSFLASISQFDGFLISLHGSTAHDHESFCGAKNIFEETVSNIQDAVDKGTSVYTSAVITKQNYHKLAELTEFSFKLGVEYVNFNRYLGPEIFNTIPTGVEFQQAIQQVDNLRKTGAKVRFGNCIPQCFYPSSSTGCLAGTIFCTIDPWGNVRPCNHANLTCGNLLTQTLEEVWHSKAMGYWRQYIPSHCVKCNEFANCHGGCRAEALRTGMGEDPLMDRAKLTLSAV